MASRENQGLQIALMVFALIVVLLAITTYVYLKAYDDTSKQLADAQSQRQEADNRARQTQGEMNALKVLMGFSADDNQETIQEGYAADMQAYAVAYPEDEQSYRKLVENQATEIKAKNGSLLQSQQRERDLKNQIAALQAETAGKVEEYLKSLTQARTDAEGEAAKFNDDRTQLITKNQGLADELETIRVETQKIQSDADEAAKKQVTEVADLRLQIEKQFGRLAKYESLSFENADGKITFADQRRRLVWINLGRADALTEQVTFSVFGIDENDAAKAKKKGSIEVIRIRGPHRAEARITGGEPADPILPSDKIYSPIWERGRRESFALAGFIDINGDGKSDNALVRDLIELQGGVIDAEASADGTVSGKMTINTRFLVLGEAPGIGAVSAQERTNRAVGGYSDIQNQASNLGVATINVHQFLDHVGWQPDDRTVMLHRGDAPKRRAAVAPDAASSPFQPRGPRYIKY